MPSTPDPKTIARRFFEEIVNAKRIDLVDEVISPDVTNHDPMPDEKPGTEGVKEILQGFFSQVPDLRVVVGFMVQEGEMVACRIVMHGTHRGFGSAEPTKAKPFVMKGTETFRVHDGKIIERWANMDDLGMLVQLGVVTVPR